MNRWTIAFASLCLALAIAAPAAAQGRHDEKPHAQMKSAPDSQKSVREAGTGGRHDEGPTSHGKKPPAKKKPEGKKSGDTESEFPAANRQSWR
jgi:hypothetical protein